MWASRTKKIFLLISGKPLANLSTNLTVMKNFLPLFLLIILFSCKQSPQYDTIIRNGMIYDGNGGEPYKADIAINADTISVIGDLSKEKAKNEIDAKGMA